jgi:mutator protein MutT
MLIMGAKPFALSVKAVIRDAAGRVLILKRSADSKNNPGKWDFPGGKVDAGEDIDSALLREVSEETGLDIELSEVLSSAESETPAKKIAYLIMGARLAGGALRLSSEHSGHLWVEPRALDKAGLCPQFMRFASDYAREPVPATPGPDSNSGEV